MKSYFSCLKRTLLPLLILGVLMTAFSACGKNGQGGDETTVPVTTSISDVTDASSSQASGSSASSGSSVSSGGSTSAPPTAVVTTAAPFPLTGISTDTKNYEKVEGNRTILSAAIDLPHFDNPSAHPVITAINNKMTEVLNGYIALLDNNLCEAALSAYKEGSATLPHTLDVNYKITNNSRTMLSVRITASVFDGGIHDYSYSFALNFNLSTGELFTPSSIFNVTASKYISLISEQITSEIAASPENYYSQYKEFISEYALYISNEAYSPYAAPLDRWFFSAEGLNVIYNPYEIATYSEGIIIFTIPYDKLTSILDVNPIY